jgi:SAM-dependent methyltransferase
VSEAWDRFWTRDQKVAGGGCLPSGQNLVDQVQRECWREFAGSLPNGARVLDLGTGDGRVMRWLAEVRGDLNLLGVDQAPSLPPAPKHTRTRGGVDIAALPFGDVSFEAATSQFGFEYADTAAAAAELARVLRSGGRFRLIVHHADGPIVSHNAARLEGLVWAARDSGLIDRARTLAAARRVAPLPTPQSFAEAVSEARSRFGTQSGGEELALAIYQTLERSRAAPVAEAIGALDTLKQLAEDEEARIRLLVAAARDRPAIALIVGQLTNAGTTVSEPREIGEPGGPSPFAWLVDGTKD